MHASISPLTLAIVGTYLLITLFIGYAFRRSGGDATAFLHARKILPTAVTALAFLAANCGALEIIGIVAASAKYGMLALHFYWMGAIPAMIFVALFMMPIYAQSRAYTVPEFLRLRFDRKTQVLSVSALSLMMGLISGISLYAISLIVRLFLGWTFQQTVTLAAAVVLCYVLVGGLRATIYNELLQLAVTIAGLAPLVFLGLRRFHGLNGMTANLPARMTHAWSGLSFIQPKLAPMDIFGIVFGLGFVLSFGYWCTDFVLIQRALAAKTLQGSMRTPLIAASFKLFFPLLVVVPGLTVAALFREGTLTTFDQALPTLMTHYYGPILLGVGISGILASLMSSLAGNISALSTICTHDLYKTYIWTDKSDTHYIWVGRVTALGATIFGVATAWMALRYNNLMDYMQLLFSLFNAPLLATFLLGMFTTSTTPDAAFWGLLSGMIAAIGHNVLFHAGWIVYGSPMSANFYGAIYGFLVCLVITVTLSTFTRRKTLEELRGVTYQTRTSVASPISGRLWVFAGVLIVVCVVLNIYFR